MNTQGETRKKVVPQITIIETYILISLLRGEKHGLGIFEDVAKLTDQQLIIVPGTLYAALKRMYNSEWIIQSDEAPPGQTTDNRSKFYRITEKGVKILLEEKEALCLTAHLIERVFNEVTQKAHLESDPKLHAQKAILRKTRGRHVRT